MNGAGHLHSDFRLEIISVCRPMLTSGEEVRCVCHNFPVMPRTLFCTLFSALFFLHVQAQHSFTLSPIHSVNIEHPSVDDLTVIGESIGDASLVLLGEQDHGDATSMQFKARMIKYLHEEKGFNVLLFESDFYSLQKNEAGQVAFARNQILPFWSNSIAMNSLWDYLLKTPSLSINGFAMGFNTEYAKLHAPEEFQQIISKLPFQESSEVLWMQENFQSLLNGTGKKVDSDARQRFYQNCDTITAQLRRILPKDRWAAQFIYNVRAKAENVWLSNYRVKHNAANLAWLLSNSYNQQKVILWTANIHGIKDYEALIDKDEKRKSNYQNVVDKDSVHTMSHTLRVKHKIPIYSLVCVSTSGSYTPQAWVNMANPQEPIVIQTGNLEESIAQDCFLDLKRLADTKQQAEFSMIPVLHKTTFTAHWPHVFDGIIFIRDQRPLSAKEE